MRGPTPRHIWRRRLALMAVIGLLIAIPVTIVLRSSEKEEPPAPASIAEQLPLNPQVFKDELDASYRVPEGWTQGEADQVLKLSSADESVQVGISAPGPAKDSGKLLDAAIADLKLTYAEVEVARGSGRKVGRLPAKGAVVSARSKADAVDLRILVAVAEGKKRAYLVEVFTAAKAPERTVAEAQRLLDSLRLNG